MKPSFLNKLFKRNEPKAFVGQPKGDWDSLGTIPFGALHTMKHYGNDNYENGYSAIQFIAKRFMKIRPYAIDNNGKPLDNVNVINVLSRPEQNMSGVQFRKTLAVMSLVHNKVYVLVWERRGKEAIPATANIREDTIAGFTILEGVQEEVFDGQIQYRVMWGNEQRVFTKQQVMSFYDVNPSDLGRGYSPSRAAKRWTRIDDYIADYQTGFFENGAVPAGMFIITAPTQKDYNDIVDNMEQHHKGAGKNNNVMYSYQAIDPSTGKPTQASVTWVPFNVDNKNLDLKTLFEQANSKIDSVYAVSAFLRGADDSAPNRSVAQTIERGFVENVLEPFVIEFWARFQHELNRITGGLGYGISYNVPIPNISEDEESEARTRTLNVSALTTLTTFGYTLDSAIDALQLPNNWKLLKQGTSAVTKIENDKEDVDDGGEVENAPDNPQTSQYMKVKAQVSTRDYPDLLDGTGVDTDDLGCIMVDVEPLKVIDVVGDNSADDLIEAVDRHDHTMGAVAEIEPHVTLLYGLLENGNIWKGKVDSLLEDWTLDTVKIKEVSYFNLPESYAVIAHIEETTELLDGHNRLTLLPHVNTFSEYRPHMTLAYIKKEADLGKWLTALNAEYQGKELKVTGINYGDEPDKDDDDKPKAQACSHDHTDPKVPKALTEDEQLFNATELEVPARELLEAQIDRAIANLPQDGVEASVKAQDGEYGEPTKDDEQKFLDDMMVIIASILLVRGIQQWEDGKLLLTGAGFSTAGLPAYSPTTDALARYRAYLKTVFDSYSKDTTEAIRAVLLRSRTEVMTRAETEALLRQLNISEEWRVKRIGVSEANKSGSQASVESMRKIAEDTGATIEKTLQSSTGSPCKFCQTLIGVWVKVDEVFVKKGAAIVAEDGSIFINKWDSNDSHDPHSNGRCTPIFRIQPN